MKVIVAVVLGMLLLMAACDADDVTLTDTGWPSGAVTPVNAAVQKLVSSEGAKIAEVRVAVVQAVTFADTSLGCPLPGEEYTQVLTPGYIITLEYAGHSYEYHADITGRLVLCQKLVCPITTS